MKDKYTAIWVSHSSIGDYRKCPRAYYLKNVYRDPKTNHKVSLMSPALALGQAVHEVIESLAVLPVDERFSVPLETKFENVWKIVHGQLGGFRDDGEEEKFKSRGKQMIERVAKHPGPLKEKAIRIRQDLPHFWLSDKDNIILCGKIDWLEYNELTDSVKILDFKTGKYDEDPDSLQLPIYYLLASACQSKTVCGIHYWYIDRDTQPVEVPLPEAEAAKERVLEIAKRIALARKLGRFICKNEQDGCAACRSLEAIVAGRAKLVGINDFGQDVYVL
ncbi:hypothetical protein A2875_00270 [Candidatus Gottesmanbacteria bacterium RIFCSPHIGHO2_01_FULL_46_14]|uniref:PD-(D/E)XK endonuclease-like domain-containing protein n=3 Tax=Candidatus Gottesmaniibacteriota TaxID=1752720 RepID=A0A1F5ZL19_9BACT|nr:MAG: hypothetical protein UY08_C0001G0015 [Candidatus Gottesmanbacteria bacterium GW2011_GWA1_47_8]OGG13121.1 MAG: hypothetical protein A2875_00270 [Candidatus Gottesmanbacteria bacterium RIFCSPHIGHO2_01_FULL_46_14]OGG30065.1 MAG: hypothetical protein A2971_02290 [Candidatus Gottesmanbacteria bacterium RIFCSPLOWO2_01_FULL_46_21]